LKLASIYFVGRKIPAKLDSLGLENVAGEGHSVHFNGGSNWAIYWTGTMRELAPSLLKSGYITEKNARGVACPLSGPALLDQRHHLHSELGTQAGVSQDLRWRENFECRL
jgi:hypothetical protein